MKKTNDSYIISEELKNHLCHIRLRNDNVVQVNLQCGIDYGITEMKSVLRNIFEISNGKKHHVLIIFCEDTSITAASIKFLSNPNVQNYSYANAYVVNTLAQKMTVNFLLSRLKPNKPKKFFENFDDAENRLKSLTSLTEYSI